MSNQKDQTAIEMNEFTKDELIIGWVSAKAALESSRELLVKWVNRFLKEERDHKKSRKVVKHFMTAELWPSSIGNFYYFYMCSKLCPQISQLMDEH